MIHAFLIFLARRRVAFCRGERAYHLKLVKLHCEAAAHYQSEQQHAEADLDVLKAGHVEPIIKRVEV